MKSNGLLTVLARLLTLAFLGVLSGHAQAAEHSALAGRVILPRDKPAPATLLILRAERKSALETPDSARYPHLPRRTQADSEGHFKFESLDPAWLYHVVIVAPGCRPASFDRVACVSEPLTAQLKAVNPNSPPDTVLHGRVLDFRGQPVSGSLIRIHGVTRKGSTTWPADNIDQFSVSDDAGNFIVFGETAFTAAEGAVEAPGFATGLFEDWASGNTVHDLTLIGGASLQGRLLREGNPVANAEIRIDRFGPESGSLFWSSTALTDNEGRFSFPHLPPNRNCRLHGLMGSLADLGAVPTRLVQVHENGSTNDIGNLNLDPAFKVEGRIRLTDGKPVPADSSLSFGNFDLGMSSPLAVGKDGSFRLTGFPAGTLTLYLRIPGYQLTPMDALLKSGSATNLTVVSNVTGLVIEMQPRTRR